MCTCVSRSPPCSARSYPAWQSVSWDAPVCQVTEDPEDTVSLDRVLTRVWEVFTIGATIEKGGNAVLFSKSSHFFLFKLLPRRARRRTSQLAICQTQKKTKAKTKDREGEKTNQLVKVFAFRGRWKRLGSRIQEAAVVVVAAAGLAGVGACTDSS